MVKSIIFFTNGNAAVTDGKKQIPKFQGSWLLKYIEFIKKNGGEVDINTKIILPNGRQARYMPEHNNWHILGDK